MAHFVKIIDSVVVDGLVINNDVVGEYPDSEIVGQQFIASLGINGEWKQTSYNNNFRKKYAGIDDTFDSVKNKFISPQPYASWSLDANDDWQAPVAYPSVTTYGDNVKYFISWDESEQKWIAYDREQNQFYWIPSSLSWISTGI